MSPKLVHAWEQMLLAANHSAALANSETFTFDLIVVSYWSLNGVAAWASQRAGYGLSTKNATGIREGRRIMLGLIQQLDALLGTKDLFLLGHELQRARRWAR